jgi:hypothetical protein
MIEPHDAVNLWAAVMQAFHYSIKEGRSMTIVQSVRMWWFIHLSEEENSGGDSCEVRISKARKVGSRCFQTIVMQFLKYASCSLTMEQGLQHRWEMATARAPPRSTPRSTSATMEQGAAPPDEESNNGGDNPSGQKRHCPSALSLSHSHQEFCESTATPTISFDEEEKMESCFGYDEFGIQIPFLTRFVTRWKSWDAAAQVKLPRLFGMHNMLLSRRLFSSLMTAEA